MNDSTDARSDRLAGADHRRLGAELDLFHIPELAPGQVFWHPAGLVILHQLEQAIRAAIRRLGYAEVQSPQLWRDQLWQESGHAEKFKELYLVADNLALKPVSCPGHCDYYRRSPRSHAELPMRLAEFGCCHRNEPSGSVQGLHRLRGFTQDDAHIFCTHEQAAGEIDRCLRLALAIYRHFELPIDLELSLRPDIRHGSNAQWDRAETALRSALDAAEASYAERPGEGAFYGPKIDIHATDQFDRRWQLGTIQLDYVLPERFDLRYINPHGQATERPVMIHRALVGSFERFIAVLLEHRGGHLPVWLAPRQARILPIGGDQAAVAAQLRDALVEAAIRCDIQSDGPLSGRIRNGEQQRIPYLLVIGRREADIRSSRCASSWNNRRPASTGKRRTHRQAGS